VLRAQDGRMSCRNSQCELACSRILNNTCPFTRALSSELLSCNLGRANAQIRLSKTGEERVQCRQPADPKHAAMNSHEVFISNKYLMAARKSISPPFPSRRPFRSLLSPPLLSPPLPPLLYLPPSPPLSSR